MIRTELSAAGIDDPDLRGAYRRCRTLNAAHGRTFFLATRLLAPDQRPPIHALYGFARYADDILDDFDPALDTVTRAARLQQLSDQFFSPVEHPSNPVLAAVRHTARRYHIADELFDDFLASMRMDLTVTDYPDRFAAMVVDARTFGVPTLGQLVRRYVAYFVSLVPLGAGFIAVGFDARKQGWHDKIANTVVIKGRR